MSCETIKKITLIAALTIEMDEQGIVRVVFRSDTHNICSRPVVDNLREVFSQMATAHLTLEIVEAIEERYVEPTVAHAATKVSDGVDDGEA